MQLLLTRELASIVSSSRISGSDKVTISTTNPGFVATEIMRESPRMGTHKDRFFKWAARARSPEVGSRTLVLAASRGRETHGAYLDDGTVSE